MSRCDRMELSKNRLEIYSSMRGMHCSRAREVPGRTFTAPMTSSGALIPRLRVILYVNIYYQSKLKTLLPTFHMHGNLFFDR